MCRVNVCICISKLKILIFDIFLGGSQWTPHVPVVAELASKTYVSEFWTDDKSIWLMVNRDKVNDETISLNLRCNKPNQYQNWTDLYNGEFLGEYFCDENSKTLIIDHEIEAGGFGALMSFSGPLDFYLHMFLAEMSIYTEIPLKEFDNEWKFLPQEILDLGYFKADENAKETMVFVNGGSMFLMVQGNAIEGTLPQKKKEHYTDRTLFQVEVFEI